MQIRSLYKDYIQKSRIFLYPSLDIKRGVSVTPIETYIAWCDYYKPADRKLCCLYYLRNDEEFKQFEKHKLIGNRLFHDFKQVEDTKGVYVFDFESLSNDWDNVINGKYSKLSPDFKRKIRHYIGLSNTNLPYIDSFLFPDRYFKIYAEMMGVDESVLKEVGELCSLPDMKHETLNISVINLDTVKEKH
jgi:hypothetical protein